MILGMSLQNSIRVAFVDFKEKIDDLVDDLEAVKSETDEVEQCKMLSKIFGDDFPIPEKKNAAKKQMNFIPSTSASGVD